MPNKGLDLQPGHLLIVRNILNKHVPAREVRAFGSRVSGSAKTYSDLDLVIMGDAPLPAGVLRELKAAFEESDLPFQVDVVEWASISGRFREVIGKEYEVLQKPV